MIWMNVSNLHGFESIFIVIFFAILGGVLDIRTKQFIESKGEDMEIK